MSTTGRRSINSTLSNSARTRRCPRSSSVSKTRKQRARAATTTAVSIMETLSWSSATTPLPMTADPRLAFEQLFGSGGTPEERASLRDIDLSILDRITKFGGART